MSARRYTVRRLSGYRKGDKRWVVWDTELGGWADDAHTTRRDAEDVRDELKAQAAEAAEQPPDPTAAPDCPPLSSST
jgi:hypothetical protein